MKKRLLKYTIDKAIQEVYNREVKGLPSSNNNLTNILISLSSSFGYELIDYFENEICTENIPKELSKLGFKIQKICGNEVKYLDYDLIERKILYFDTTGKIYKNVKIGNEDNLVSVSYDTYKEYYAKYKELFLYVEKNGFNYKSVPNRDKTKTFYLIGYNAKYQFYVCNDILYFSKKGERAKSIIDKYKQKTAYWVAYDCLQRLK